MRRNARRSGLPGETRTGAALTPATRDTVNEVATPPAHATDTITLSADALLPAFGMTGRVIPARWVRRLSPHPIPHLARALPLVNAALC